MRQRIRNQRGAGGLGCLVTIAVAAAAIYAGLELGMPRLRHSSFSDRMSETMSFFSRQPEKYVRDRTMQVAAEFHIDLKPEQVKVRIENNTVTVDVAYEKFVDLKVWQTTLPFTLHRSAAY